MNKYFVPSLVFTTVLLYPSGCSEKPTGYSCSCSKITNYEVHPTVTTAYGIEVDTSGFDVNLDLLDQETEMLEQCLALSIDRSGFVVKVAPDWYTSLCSGNQGFPCNLSPSVCFGDKPQPDPRCPCACAGAVQPPNILVVTPNLAAYRHELIHLVTNTADHTDPRFERCEKLH